MSKYKIVGLMSGTSLDGLDIVHVCFNIKKDKWTYKILDSDTISYPEELLNRLKTATELDVLQMEILNKDFGREMASMVNAFFIEKKIESATIDAIASHGQTIFHQPERGFSLQIGCGASLAFETGVNVINDFRSKDIIAGGQGAPLVPIGDMKLFSNDADAFLNLGGFCNISFQNENREWVAFDISPCNLPLNRVANQKGLIYDEGGAIAKLGDVDQQLLENLNNIEYYKKTYPKSLGTEWLEEKFYPNLKFDSSPEENMRTLVEHIAMQIGKVLSDNNIGKVLITGGGALNSFLIERIKIHTECAIFLPKRETIDFKEALIFALLGALFLNDEPSNVPTATGANKAVKLGVLHCP